MVAFGCPLRAVVLGGRATSIPLSLPQLQLDGTEAVSPLRPCRSVCCSMCEKVLSESTTGGVSWVGGRFFIPSATGVADPSWGSTSSASSPDTPSHCFASDGVPRPTVRARPAGRCRRRDGARSHARATGADAALHLLAWPALPRPLASSHRFAGDGSGRSRLAGYARCAARETRPTPRCCASQCGARNARRGASQDARDARAKRCAMREAMREAMRDHHRR